MSHDSLAQQQAFFSLLNRSCQQRRFFLQSRANEAKTRNNGNTWLASATIDGVSPTFSTDDLDMRRKAEILQYKGASTQGGQQETRAQYFAKLNRRGSSRYADFSNYITSIRTCLSNKDYIPTPTSSSGIPGPIMNIVYNPSVPLYNYVGMQQNMPNNLSIPPIINKYTPQIKSSSEMITKYNDYYNTIASTSEPFFVAQITYYTLTLPPNTPLVCTLKLKLDFELNFNMLDVFKIPNNQDYLTAVYMVKTIQLKIAKVQAIVYLMTEPQILTENYVLMSTDIPFEVNQTSALLPDIPYDGNDMVTQRWMMTFEPNAPIQFPITDAFKAAIVPEQSVRISMNVDYSLLFFYSDGVSQFSSSTKMNITNMSAKFTLTPSSVTFSVPQ